MGGMGLEMPNYYKFLVKFNMMGEFEIAASNSVEAQEIVKEMSDKEIQHLAEYSFESMEVNEEPEMI